MNKRLPALLAAAGLTVLLTACSSGGSTPDKAATSPSNAATSRGNSPGVVAANRHLQFRVVIGSLAPNTGTGSTELPITMAAAGVGDPMDPHATAAISAKLADSTCPSTPKPIKVAQAGRVLLACDAQGKRYLLGPTVLSTDVKSAQSGQNPGVTVVDMQVDAPGKLGKLSKELTTTRNPVAIVTRGTVLSAFTFTSPIRTGNVEISGGFTKTSAMNLARQLSGLPTK
ncbi:MAG: Preprotein translocase subunit SecD [Marmoricola sp.]|nr:Preprotein translocase subunit SecD [Marmoricola sp.]